MRGIVAAWLVSLAFAAGAAWGAGPALVVGHDATQRQTRTSIEIAPPAGTAVVQLLVPAGYALRPDAAPGEPVGRVTSAAVLVGGSRVEVAGELRGADAGAELPAACADGSADAVWRLRLHGGGTELEVLLAVVATGGGFEIRGCLPPAGGPELASVAFELGEARLEPSRGPAQWTATFTPLAASGEPDTTRTVEARSLSLVPVRLRLRASFRPVSGNVLVQGALAAGGEPVDGARVQLWAGPGSWPRTPAGRVTTTRAGTFSAERAIHETTSFRASVDVPVRNAPAGCSDPRAAAGCVSSVVGPYAAESEAVRVKWTQPTLKLGSRGAAVVRLRAALSRLGYLPPGGSGSTFDDRTWHAVVALQGWSGLPRTGTVVRSTWRALARGVRPRPWGGLRRGVQIDTRRQVMLLVEGGRVVRAIHVSTGAGGRTPLGHFSVYRKERLSWSVPFSVWMPYASYFRGGFAMHAYPSVPPYPASHGCVRVPPVEAPGVYAFASYGTPVWVR
jgi:hypothetical protein